MIIARENNAGPQDNGGLIYVAGIARCGSTLFGLALGMADDHIFVGELRSIWDEGVRRNFLCNCGVPFHECSFWSAVMDEAYGGMDACLSRNIHQLSEKIVKKTAFRDIFDPSRRSASLQRDIDTLNAETLTLHQAIRKISGKSWIVDISKNANCAWMNSALYGPKLKLISLTRDPRGVAFSMTRVKFKPENRDPSATLNRARPWASARKWVKRHREIERLSGQAEVTHLTYEEFLQDTPSALAKVFDQEQVEQVLEGLGAAAIERPMSHAVAGNPHRFQKSGLVLKLDEEWKTGLALKDRLIVQAIAAPLMRKYGYH